MIPRTTLVPCSVALAVLLAAAALAADPEAYDLVIRGGRIADGTGNPWFHGDVAVRDGRIALVGRVDSSRARRVFDAAGLVVAPGFIDIHSHSDWVLLEDGAAESKIRQGVTTEVLGEDSSGGPFLGKAGPRRQVVAGETLEWSTLGEYFDLLERRKIAVNIASYVGLGNVWRCVLGESHARPTEAELARMEELIAQAMDEGARGLSTMLAQAPTLATTTDDLVRLCRPVAARGGIYSSHIRNEGTEVFDAVREAIAVGERAGLKVDIIHLKIADQRLWNRMREIVGLIDDARRRGVDVQANVYPYTRGNNDLASIVPPWAHEGGAKRMLERFADAAERERIKKDIREGIPGWYDHYLAVGGDWTRMLLSADLRPPNDRFEGKTMDVVVREKSAGRADADPLDVLLDFIAEEGGSVGTIYAHHTEEDMTHALSRPWCSVGSDGSAFAIAGPLRRGTPHPRSFGTFPRVLAAYVRESELLRLEDAVRKMTSLNARKIGLDDRGLLRAGLAADIVVFDAARVADRATYLEPFQYPVGIELVVVNGEIVLEKGERTPARPGRALRSARR